MTGVMSGSCCPWLGMLVGNHRGAEGEELDDVAAPAVVVLVQLDLHDPEHAVTDVLGLFLHALHRELARVIEGLGVLLELDVLTGLTHRLDHAAMRDVVDAVPHDQAHRSLAGLHQRPERLTD